MTRLLSHRDQSVARARWHGTALGLLRPILAFTLSWSSSVSIESAPGAKLLAVVFLQLREARFTHPPLVVVLVHPGVVSLAVGFDVFDEGRIVSEPRVEEVGVRQGHLPRLRVR